MPTNLIVLLVAQAVEQLGDPAGDATLTLRRPDL